MMEAKSKLNKKETKCKQMKNAKYSYEQKTNLIKKILSNQYSLLNVKLYFYINFKYNLNNLFFKKRQLKK